MDEIKKTIKIGTLGPSGTSSEAAVKYFLHLYEKSSNDYSIVLLDNFKSVLHELTYGDLSIAIVPHAYSDINLFYINPKIQLYKMFEFKTPSYGLAKRSETVIPYHHCRVVSHPAPILILDMLIAQMGISHYEVIHVSSTSKAAEEVFEGRAELALTNMNAIKKYDLLCCAMYGPIQMGWSVFVKKEV